MTDTAEASLQRLAEMPPAAQQPEWPDAAELSASVDRLSQREPLVTLESIAKLGDKLSEVAAGEAFMLQHGDCAERLVDDPAVLKDSLRDSLGTVLQMNMIISFGAGVPVTKVLRAAGQFAKPRSSSVEEKDGVVLPSFRGEIVNGTEFTANARTPDPRRMERAYEQSQQTLRIIAELSKGDFADITRIFDRNSAFVSDKLPVPRYQELILEIGRTLDFMRAFGVDVDNLQELHQADVFSSHEALLMEYELALTRQQEDVDYDSSAHMVWIGERTRDINGAHVALARDIVNPVGVKLGPAATPAEVLELCETLNPNRIPGKLTLINRLGADAVSGVLPARINAVESEGHSVIWGSDPMHGNTIATASGRKTRRVDDIIRELDGFFEVCAARGVWPGAVHLEATGKDVSECLGGNALEVPTEDAHLERNYETACDPRLNHKQSLELAFLIAEHLSKLKRS